MVDTGAYMANQMDDQITGGIKQMDAIYAAFDEVRDHGDCNAVYLKENFQQHELELLLKGIISRLDHLMKHHLGDADVLVEKNGLWKEKRELEEALKK